MKNDLICPKGCKPTRTSVGGTVGTQMGWTPIYDEDGAVVEGQDPNTYTTDYHCHQCGARWTVSHTGDKPTVSEPWWPKPVEAIEVGTGNLSYVALDSEWDIGGGGGC